MLDEKSLIIRFESCIKSIKDLKEVLDKLTELEIEEISKELYNVTEEFCKLVVL